MNYLDQIDSPTSPIAVTPLKTGGRADWHVSTSTETSSAPAAFIDTDIVAQLRRFFDAIDLEAADRCDDPIAMVNALARMEALLADVRYVTNTIRKHTADALAEHKVRRITIDNVATMEATSEADRTDWQDQALTTDMLANAYPPLINSHTGEVVHVAALAETILSWMRPAWRLTPIRDAGLDPDDYSTQPKNEDGTPLRTPTVRVHDNTFRKDTITKEVSA